MMMIAMITRARSLEHAVQYNEQKVAGGKARILLVRHYPSPIEHLSVREKIDRLQAQANLNPRVRKPCLHITLNFDAKEELDPAACCILAADYLQRIGFGAQPCLVYQHLDAAHPHLHLVTTPVDADGKRIPLNNLIRKDSLQVTMDMEREYDLQRTHLTKDRPVQYELQLPPSRALDEAPAAPIAYGQETMLPAVTRVLHKVFGGYRFTSLEAFNALLKPYHLVADRGRPGSQIFLHRGLIYKVLDEEGKQKGNYIKASHLPGKPTLAYLEKRFAAFLPGQEAEAGRIRTIVDWSLLPETGLTLARLHRDLEEAGIEAQWTIPKGGNLPSIVYIDHKARWALSEAVLGPRYSAPSVLELCQVQQQDLEKALEQSVDAKKISRGRELLL
jgi:hypothetical protein